VSKQLSPQVFSGYSSCQTGPRMVYLVSDGILFLTFYCVKVFYFFDFLAVSDYAGWTNTEHTGDSSIRVRLRFQSTTSPYHFSSPAIHLVSVGRRTDKGMCPILPADRAGSQSYCLIT